MSLRNRACEGFIEECKSNPGRFEERIKKQKIHSFAKESSNFKLTNKNKIIEVKMEQDLFRSILFLPLQRKIDIGEMLKFPLTPVPLCLAHIDGSMQKTRKSSLLKELETRVISKALSNTDTFVIDGDFLKNYQKRFAY